MIFTYYGQYLFLASQPYSGHFLLSSWGLVAGILSIHLWVSVLSRVMVSQVFTPLVALWCLLHTYIHKTVSFSPHSYSDFCLLWAGESVYNKLIPSLQDTFACTWIHFWILYSVPLVSCHVPKPPHSNYRESHDIFLYW